MTDAPLQLSIRDLTVTVEEKTGARTLLDRVSLDLAKGEVLGLVGESGSGKSLFCRALVGLLPSQSLRLAQGTVLLDGEDIAKASPEALQAIRGARIGMIFQNPTSHLDPVMRIGDQIVEGVAFHQGLNRMEAKAAALEIMRQVGFTDPPRQFGNYAHEFSGGMRQRAMIAIALACNPEILIADEPTTALDVTIQAQILDLLLDLRKTRGLSIILITHDLGVVAQTCDRIAVMRHGRLIEIGEKRTILKNPREDYTRTLIASHPSMPAETAPAAALTQEPSTIKLRPLVEIDDLHVRFPVGGGLLSRRKTFSAVGGVSLQILPGETVGIVGESGSGKSTLARAMLGLTPLSDGHVTFDGHSLSLKRAETLKALRSQAAMVFQDPYNSLNPRLTIGETLSEVLRVQKKVPDAAIPARVEALLDLVELDRSFAGRKPRSLSGGQCQRAGIARALAVEPRLIVADECIAALDVTIQAQIVALLRKLVSTMDLTLVFIAHDLAVVRALCQRVVVMHHGRIVEEGPSETVFANPREAYTAALIAAIPDFDPDRPLSGRSLPLPPLKGQPA
ncbi:ABC transporter ATP-binding protein [Xaviernesmea oryzae]|uniref:ABC transporter ATP-binding protein n=1 Tax=Xaviernesmea oryzae TaxID=464029 RepID=A0A1Q9B2F6_9HYPH|nr:ABC transporter ATP-binding protein [Xaviernesmea oryzae]OLP62189.1 ABC transporter ATP-binding protein [Xaviernesmea oryzae]SEL91079.1 peptide/nickel transport system ATP-binding protein [Xaviernesmea oryzae]